MAEITSQLAAKIEERTCSAQAHLRDALADIEALKQEGAIQNGLRPQLVALVGKMNALDESFPAILRAAHEAYGSVKR